MNQQRKSGALVPRLGAGGRGLRAEPSRYPAHQLADVCRVRLLTRAVQSPASAVLASPLPPALTVCGQLDLHFLLKLIWIWNLAA